MAIKNQIEKVDLKLQKLIDENSEYKDRCDIIQSMPGAGKVVTFCLLSNMPELGYITNKQVASLIGVTHVNKESDTYKGQRQI